MDREQALKRIMIAHKVALVGYMLTVAAMMLTVLTGGLGFGSHNPLLSAKTRNELRAISYRTTAERDAIIARLKADIAARRR